MLSNTGSVNRTQYVFLVVVATVGIMFSMVDAFTPLSSTTSSLSSQPNLRFQRIHQQHSIMTSTSTTTSKTTTVLFASSHRRAIFQRTKKAIIGSVASIGLLKFLPISTARAVETTAVVADASVTLLDPSAKEQPTGRIVEFTVQNLDGESGKNGVVKIQLEPTWSPKGVQRFEVRTCV
jgi:hypothetical protein